MILAHEDSAPAIAFGRSVCGDLADAERREWLVTNGLGGFASGTIAGSLTRRYHGLLIAALRPPAQRTLLVSKLDESLRYRGAQYDLSTNRWKDDYVAPAGYVNIERFYLDGAMPVWHYAAADAIVGKRVWMEHGANTTFVRYRVLRASGPVELRLRVLVNYRDFHGNTHAGDRTFGVVQDGTGLRVDAFEGALPFRVLADGGEAAIENLWCRDFVLSMETRRGLDDRDDNLSAGYITATLLPGEELTVAATAQDEPPAFGGALQRRRDHEAGVLAAWRKTPAAERAPRWMRQCVLAADQFVVKRPLPNDPDALSVIAGYHWFGDWGRDTMISLPGLALVTGRPEIARKILTTFAQFVDGGMLPNDFPEGGEAPQYNTVDAALWYVEAVARYVEATGDRATVKTLWPVVGSIVDAYRAGTRFGIHADADGLIVAGSPGLQLTWMDAKIGDRVITARTGKPVEIAALWYNALCRMQMLAAMLGVASAEYAALAEMVRNGFERFWNPQTNCCFDVLDGPGGNDGSIRPNQLFAVALPHALLSRDRQRSIVDVCAAGLLTSNGLRTLSPSDPHFIPSYGGTPQERDAAYHEGTAWPWLLGAFAVAHARAYGNTAVARSFLEPLADQLFDRGLGSISEIAEPLPPFAPIGAIAQAWSVGELLRGWQDAGRMGGS